MLQAKAKSPVTATKWGSQVNADRLSDLFGRSCGAVSLQPEIFECIDEGGTL